MKNIKTYATPGKGFISGIHDTTSYLARKFDPAYLQPLVINQLATPLLGPLWAVCEIPGTDEVRVLPRDYLGAPGASEGSQAIPVQRPQIFVSGDVLTVVPPYARIDLALTWAPGDQIEVEIAGIAVTYTVADSILANIALGLASAINGSAPFSEIIKAEAQGPSIHLHSKDFESIYTLSVTAATAGDGDATVAGSLTSLVPYQEIGTVVGVDVENDQLNLIANSLLTLPPGFPISAQSGRYLGLLREQQDLNEQSHVVSIFTMCTVAEASLPYWDPSMKRATPQIELV